MHDLVYALKCLAEQHREGSFATQANRKHMLMLCGTQLVAAGYTRLHATELKGRHIQCLLALWQAQGVAPRTIENRLTQDVKQAALQQVLFYWRKMREVAENITETEVRLCLPEQSTAKGRTFAIEGIVDIIREGDHTVMYDIKTHDADYVLANKDLYEKQLNIYAHIWQHLRQQPLDATAIIATSYPAFVKEALSDPRELAAALSRWNPLIEIPFNPQHVQETIADFGAVVDQIEEKAFAAPPVEKLQTLIPGAGNNHSFATHVCQNCDARFSCMSYRNHRGSTGGRAARSFHDFSSEADQEVWLQANLEAALAPAGALG